MTLTLLLDLDNTLLLNDMDKFLPRYLEGLGRHLSQYIEPDKLIRALIAATQEMIANNYPDKTLKSILNSFLIQKFGWDSPEIQEAFETYFSQEYPKLQMVTQKRPEAVELVNHAINRGYNVVIATNPLFPQTAIYQRLNWAGLSPDQIPFGLITTLDNFHFAKPNPAYYAEILALLGWPDTPAIMVGDDLDRDITPSRKLGLQAIWAHTNGSPQSVIGGDCERTKPSALLKLQDILPWIDQSELSSQAPDFHHQTAIIATLQSTPAAIANLTSSLPDTFWEFRPGSDEWNLYEISCHLRDVELKVNLPRIRQVVHENNPFLTAIDTDSWKNKQHHKNQNKSEALQTFIEVRIETLELLWHLEEKEWQRPARHAIFGPTRLQELINFIAEHDRLHMRQVRHIFQRMKSQKLRKQGGI